MDGWAKKGNQLALACVLGSCRRRLLPCRYVGRRSLGHGRGEREKGKWDFCRTVLAGSGFGEQRPSRDWRWAGVFGLWAVPRLLGEQLAFDGRPVAVGGKAAAWVFMEAARQRQGTALASLCVCCLYRRLGLESIKKGSFTVEAAFVLPLILAVLFAIIRSGFLLHDEAVLEAAALRLLEKGEMAVKHLGDMETGRPDYERILLEAGSLENADAQERMLREELLGQFFMKEVSALRLEVSGTFSEEKKIELLGNAGKRSLPVFHPAEHKRRVK